MKNKDALFYANQVIAYAKENNLNVNNTRLNHILYAMQSLNYMLEKKPLFDDDFLAFKKGPLVYSVFCEFSSFANSDIDIDTKKIKIILNNLQKDMIILILNNEPKLLIQTITYDNGAWNKTISRQFGIGQIIPKELIKLDADIIFKKDKIQQLNNCILNDYMLQ